MRDGGEFEPLFLARTGPPVSISSRYHEGTPAHRRSTTTRTSTSSTPTRSNTTGSTARPRGKAALITATSRDFLLAPEAGRRPLPAHALHRLRHAARDRATRCRDVPIVYTLHEFLPICHRNGQMVRTTTEKPCSEESPRRCHECFPEISPQAFFMRKRFIQSQHVRSSTASSPRAASSATATSTGASRRRRSSSRSTGGCRSTAAGDPRPAPAQPLRLLRPAQLLQGRQRPAEGDEAARRTTTSTSTSRSTAPTSSCSRTSSATNSTTLLEATEATVTLRRASSTTTTCRR